MEKRCSKCKETKPIKEFSKNKYAQDRYQNRCKNCAKDYRQSSKGKSAQKRYIQSDKGKQTQRRRNQSKEGKQSQALYNQSDKGQQTRKKYRQSEAYRQSQKLYKQSNKRKQSNGKYQQSIKGKQSKNRNKNIRRARQTQGGGSYTTAEWYNLCKFYDFHCLKCNRKFPFEELSLDHVKPISKDGCSSIWNIQPLCKRCNSSKGNKEIDYRKTLPDWISRDGPVWQQRKLF